MAKPDETRIIRSGNLFEHAILPQNRDEIAQLFDDPKSFLELLTGCLTLDRQGLRKSNCRGDEHYIPPESTPFPAISAGLSFQQFRGVL